MVDELARFIVSVGFPVFVVAFLMIRIETLMREMLKVQERHSEIPISVKDCPTLLMPLWISILALIPLRVFAQPAGTTHFDRIIANTMVVNKGVQDTFAPYINVKNAPYSARGDGVTSDAAAIRRAIADGQSANKCVFFPTGTYIIDSPINATSTTRLCLVGSPALNTIIKVSSGIYFIDIPATKVLGTAYFSDFQIVGPGGFVRQLSTAANTGVSQIFSRIMCFNQAGIACIQTNASDLAVIHFNNIRLLAANSVDTIGIAISGTATGATFDTIECGRERICIKMPAFGSQGSTITRNTFTRSDMVVTGGPRIGIWLVPTASINQNGPVIFGNYFGNEDLVSGDFYVVVAEELPGADNGSRMPDLSTVSTKQAGIFFTNNTLVDAGPIGTPLARQFLFSTTPNINATFDNTICAGTLPLYWIGYAAGAFPATRTSERVTDSQNCGDAGAGISASNATTVSAIAGYAYNYGGTGSSTLATRTATSVFFSACGANGSSAIERQEKCVTTVPQKMRDLFCIVDTAPGTGNSYTFRLRSNGVNSTIGCTISGAATTCSDNTNTQWYVRGDQFNYVATTRVGGVAPTATGARCAVRAIQ